MNKGILYAVAAYTTWGLMPIYWKTLHGLPATEIMSHRIVWSLVFLALILTIRKHWRWLGTAVKNKRIMLTFLLSATALALNWGTYIWGVNHNHVVETSLGYFINPLVSVLLGVLFLRERLRHGQWVAIAIAAGGVLYLTALYGALPWISLTLAFSFGSYGLIRKTAPLGALEGLSLEMGLLFLPALGYLLYLDQSGGSAFAHAGWQTSLILAGSGVATAVPLLWFGLAARRIPLATIGILQYIAPSIQLLLGIFLYNEPFSPAQLVGFCLIWSALFIYSVEGMLHKAPGASQDTIGEFMSTTGRCEGDESEWVVDKKQP
ncbi:MAG: EamA family transporter RarD [Chloroflexi bacterium]|nr:EamA family transporter RarD [Chloroflexota bacterium]